MSTADAREAAKERVRQELRLSPQAALFSNVFVGRRQDETDEPVICGTVRGTSSDGARIPPRRFIVGTGEPRWLSFERLDAATHVTPTDRFPEWAELCRGAEGEPAAGAISAADLSKS